MLLFYTACCVDDDDLVDHVTSKSKSCLIEVALLPAIGVSCIRSGIRSRIPRT